MSILRHVLVGLFAVGLGGLAATPAGAQCSVTITVDGGNPTTRAGSCQAALNGLETIGPIRMQQFNWVSQVDAAGGYRFDIHAEFMNDVDPNHLPHTIDALVTVTQMPTGLRRWYSSYSGEGHEVPGPSGDMSDGILAVNPNHMNSAVTGVQVGNFDYPLNDTPSPVSDPYGCLEEVFCQQGPVLINGNGTGTIHLQMTLGRGDVNNLKHTASLYSPSNSAVPATSTWGLLAMLLALGGGGLYLISRGRG